MPSQGATRIHSMLGTTINWNNMEPSFGQWLQTHGPADVRPLPPGYEADVAVLTDGDRPRFVLKRGTRPWRMDATDQSQFLLRAKAVGLPVPAPVATGVDSEGRPVSVTEYCGEPLANASDSELRRAGGILAWIHRLPPEALGFESPPPPANAVDCIVARFFPRLARHPDIRSACLTAAAGVEVTDPRVIHGDFNLGNVLRDVEGHLTIIDWSEVGAGDPRYDLAWALVVTWIYSGSHAAQELLSGYLTATEAQIDLHVLTCLQTVAALQWILLDRLVTLKEGQATRGDIANFVEANLPDGWRGRFAMS